MNDIDKILDKIRQNSVILSSYHRKRYLTVKSRLKYFKIPIILLSSINSVGAVSMQGFLAQTYISLINMGLSLIVGIISALEMFYKLSDQMISEDNGSRDFYILSVDIFKYLSLDKSNREMDEKVFLNDAWTRYTKLIETSYILKKKVNDLLVTFDSNCLPETPCSIPITISTSTETFQDSSETSSDP